MVTFAKLIGRPSPPTEFVMAQLWIDGPIDCGGGYRVQVGVHFDWCLDFPGSGKTHKVVVPMVVVPMVVELDAVEQLAGKELIEQQMTEEAVAIGIKIEKVDEEQSAGSAGPNVDKKDAQQNFEPPKFDFSPDPPQS